MTRFTLSTGGLVAWSLHLCESCIGQQHAIAQEQPAFVRPRIESYPQRTNEPCAFCEPQVAR